MFLWVLCCCTCIWFISSVCFYWSIRFAKLTSSLLSYLFLLNLLYLYQVCPLCILLLGLWSLYNDMVIWSGHSTWLLDTAHNFILAISWSHDFSSSQITITFRLTTYTWYKTYDLCLWLKPISYIISSTLYIQFYKFFCQVAWTFNLCLLFYSGNAGVGQSHITKESYRISDNNAGAGITLHFLAL